MRRIRGGKPPRRSHNRSSAPRPSTASNATISGVSFARAMISKAIEAAMPHATSTRFSFSGSSPASRALMPPLIFPQGAFALDRPRDAKRSADDLGFSRDFDLPDGLRRGDFLREEVDAAGGGCGLV